MIMAASEIKEDNSVMIHKKRLSRTCIAFILSWIMEKMWSKGNRSLKYVSLIGDIVKLEVLFSIVFYLILLCKEALIRYQLYTQYSAKWKTNMERLGGSVG